MEVAEQSSQRRWSDRQATWLWWCICAVVFALLYLATCQRGVSWQDSGMFQRRVLEGDYEGKLGLALAHPLYIAAGRLIVTVPLGDAAGRLNFLSGLGMAVALANLMAVATLLTGRRWIGVGVAAMLAVCHTVWWLSTIAEVYTWSVAGLTGELWLLVVLLRRPRWRLLVALSLVSGLGLCVHNFALLPLPVYLAVAIVLVSRRKLPAWSLAAVAGGYVIGASMYIAMTVNLAIVSGSVGEAVHSALFGNYAPQVLNVSAASKYTIANAALGAMNLVSFLLPLAVIGWMRLCRKLGRETAWALGAITVIEIVFVLRYPVPDQFTFLLPSLVMLTLAAAVGLSVLADASKRWRIVAMTACGLSVLIPPIFYAAAPALARAGGVGEVRARKLPYRDELRYWMTPWKHSEDSAERFAEAALAIAAPDGVILADSTSDEALLIVQSRNDLTVGVLVPHDDVRLPSYDADPSAFRCALGERALYVVSPAGGHLPSRLVQNLQDGTVELHPVQKDGVVILYRMRWLSQEPGSGGNLLP